MHRHSVAPPFRKSSPHKVFSGARLLSTFFLPYYYQGESFFIGVNPPEGREEGELDRSPLGTCRAMFITRQDAERGRSRHVKGSLRRERTLAPLTRLPALYGINGPDTHKKDLILGDLRSAELEDHIGFLVWIER